MTAHGNKLLLVALKFAPVHRIHMLGYRFAFLRQLGTSEVTWVVADEYAQNLRTEDRIIQTGPGAQYGALAMNLAKQVCWIRGLTAHELFSDGGQAALIHVFFQTSHPANYLLMDRLRQLYPRVSIRLYVHEPTSLWEKVRKGDGLLRSALVYLTQSLELSKVDIFYVANDYALRSANQAYPVYAHKGAVLPLPFVDLCPDWQPTFNRGMQNQVLLLGRANRTRCLDVFLGMAKTAAARRMSLRFAILSGQRVKLPVWARDLPNLRVIDGRTYSDSEMGRQLLASCYVFNLFRVPYTQSGVTPVALMFGRPVIAHSRERDPALEAAGCIYLPRVPDGSELLEMILVRRQQVDPVALREAYFSRFDWSSIRIPA